MNAGSLAASRAATPPCSTAVLRAFWNWVAAVSLMLASWSERKSKRLFRMLVDM
jgi:hypothetical protein